MPTEKAPVILWLRRDLRLADHEAIFSASQTGLPLIFVYIHTETPPHGIKPAGGASRWWLHHSLLAFAKQLESFQQRLILRIGAPQQELLKLVQETSAQAVFWQKIHEPAEQELENQVQFELNRLGLDTGCFSGGLLTDPDQLKTRTGGPYQVFTPFWKAASLQIPSQPPLPLPAKLPAPANWPQSCSLADFQLAPLIPWAEGIQAAWTPGAVAAQKQWRQFLEQPVQEYASNRDFPAISGTSRLSPYLHFGEISPRQLYHDTQQQLSRLAITNRNGSKKQNSSTNKTNQADISEQFLCFLKELGWREFAHSILWHFPETEHFPLRKSFRDFPWENQPKMLRAWQRGQTGFPIVDAGMRELWATGWMHNRVRMIVASFLTKDLFISWQAGAEWFWDTLVDADLANNTLGWQWTAGCGADAAPYFRIFNPVLQSEKFDPAGIYIKKWCPELAGLPLKSLHAPWTAPKPVLQSAGVRLGKDYPFPLVDHARQRQKALSIWENLN